MSETKETHVHVREDGTVIEHSHGPHGHHHSHEQTKAVLNRLSRAIGHLESIKRMVEDGRDYPGVKELRKLFYAEENSLDFTTFEALRETLCHLEDRGGEIYPLTREAYEDAERKIAGEKK